MMAVYNDIQLDGRVQRAVKALAYDFDVLICSVNSSSDYTDVPCRNANLKIGKFTFVRFLLALVKIYLKERPDVLYLHDYNMVAMVPLLWPFRKCKIVYDAHETIAVNKRSITRPIVRWFAKLEKMVIHSFDLIITPIEERATFMRRYYHIKDIELFKNIPEYSFTELPVKDNDPNRPVKIIYQGVINKNRKLDRLIYLAQELGDHYQFDMVGYGSDEESLKQMVNDLQLKNVHFLGKVSPQNLHTHLLHADIGLAFYPMDVVNTRFCAPNKIYEYAQAQLIVVSSNQWLFRDTFKQYPFGVTVDIEKEEISSIAQKIREISTSRTEHIQHAKAFLANNNAEKEFDHLKMVMKKLLS